MSVVTVGDFDGVHLGHRDLLRQAAALAGSLHADSVAVTFDRNCKSVLRGDPVLQLTTAEEKREKILSCGIMRVETLSFDASLISLSPDGFLDLLRERFGCTVLLGGSDFRYGFGGSGTLTDGATVRGIRQVTVELRKDRTKISSSEIRTALTDGKPEEAMRRLGEPYSIRGTVIPGHQLGRTVGFPTLNLDLPAEKLLPKNGVYVTDAAVDGQTFRAVTNVGVRPTVSDEGVRNVETHLIGADGDFYGKTARVFFLSRLRDERRFPDLSALTRQLCADREAALRFLVQSCDICTNPG